MSRPKVSVLLPAYNHAKFIEETIESVINQTYRDFEFIICDDASTDGTVEKIMKYEKYIDEIHLFDENAGGRGGFLRTRAKGDYVAILNSDDVWTIDKLEKQVKALEEHPDVVACFTWCDRIDEDGKKIDGFNPFNVHARDKAEWMNYLFFNGNCFAHASVLIKQDIYQEIYSNNVLIYRQIPDYYRWVLLLQKYDVIVLEECLTKIRTSIKAGRENVSAFTKENLLRQFNEETYMWYKIISNMEDDFFIRVFKNELIDVEAEDKIEVMCEKFFILLQCRFEYSKGAAILFLYEHYAEMAEWLQCRYQFTNKDVYNIVINVGPSKLLS